MKLDRLLDVSQSEAYADVHPISSIRKDKSVSSTGVLEKQSSRVDEPEIVEKRKSERKRKAASATESHCKNSFKKARNGDGDREGVVWDGSFSPQMQFSNSEKERITSLMRCDKVIFQVDHNRISTSKNPALLSSLTMQDDPQLALKLWNLREDNYEAVTGSKLQSEKPEEDTNNEQQEMSLNRLGRDLPDELLKVSNSASFYRTMTTMYNKLSQFSSEVPEFCHFDWLNAPLKDIDFSLKIFFEWLQPLKNSSAMGDRTTTGTNKTYKTGIQNIFKFLLKRPDVVLSRHSCGMALAMQAYKGKNAAYAASGQIVPEGSRERKAILDEDQEKRDQWLTRPLNQLTDPKELTLTVAAIVGDQACHRGVTVLKDIGRSAFKTNQFDENGKEYVLIHQAVQQKKDSGYATRPFRPFKKQITGDFEVNAIKLLLSNLPVVGCAHCSDSDNSKCVCDEFLLRSLPLDSWEFNDQVWFARQKWSDWKKSQVNAEISKRAQLSQIYTNSSARPTGITNMGRAGYSAAEISAVSEHTDMNTLEKYKKLANLTQATDRHKAGLILAPSGRQPLRGASNQFGVVATNEKSIFNNVSTPSAAQGDQIIAVAGSSGARSGKMKQVRFAENKTDAGKPHKLLQIHHSRLAKKCLLR